MDSSLAPSPLNGDAVRCRCLLALLPPPPPPQYEVIRYADPDVELAATDLMALEGRQLPRPEPGRYLALRLAFSLPSSCYATMLIRELTKQPTSTEHHKSMRHAP